MPMNIVPPPLPARNAEQPSAAALSSSLPSGALPRVPAGSQAHQQAAYYHHHLHHHHLHQPYRQVVASPTDTTSTSSEYHLMTGGLASPVLPLATPLSSPDSNYLPMDMGSSQVSPPSSLRNSFPSAVADTLVTL